MSGPVIQIEAQSVSTGNPEGKGLSPVVQWPYDAERFLPPAVPLTAAYVWALARGVKTRVLRVATAWYLVLFIANGISLSSYSIWLGALRGSRFPQTYGGGSERNNYRAAFGDCPIDPCRPPANPAYVDVLRFYKPTFPFWAVTDNLLMTSDAFIHTGFSVIRTLRRSTANG